MDHYTDLSQYDTYFSLGANGGNENGGAPLYLFNSSLTGTTNFGSNGSYPDMILFQSGRTDLPTIGGAGLWNRWNLSVDGQVRVGTVSTTGVAVGRSASGILGTVTSDQRLKTNIDQITGATTIINNLRGVYFNWLETDDFKPEDETRQIGMIAQEVEEFLPEAVTLNGNKDYKTIRYSEMIGLLVNGIKEQNEIIKSLQSEIELIKNRLDSL